jgi:hypothetical protein
MEVSRVVTFVIEMRMMGNWWPDILIRRPVVVVRVTGRCDYSEVFSNTVTVTVTVTVVGPTD